MLDDGAREAASCLIGDILLSSNPLCPRVRPSECGGRPFSYSAWWIQLLNGWMSTCGWLAVFPRLKGGVSSIVSLPPDGTTNKEIVTFVQFQQPSLFQGYLNLYACTETF
ncbi:uncharacterized protein LOC124314893 [Daphnia pulicaria]|uniref:uncharacterized protein LOC124314893 n=1 Tax=Daphnia pulicaria TaxID=35523 RepID=UPI001EEC83D3|nr:uncharacterized protein LOC124314893 [Daphnia pulicaria]